MRATWNKNMLDLTTQLEQERRRVDFDTFDISVKELVSMADQGIINIAPTYQRQFRWPEKNQSLLIESVFLGIPIPSLFMAANQDGSWELIDGVQRLSSLIHFTGNSDQQKKISQKTPLKLTGLDVLTSFEDKTYSELPATIQLKFSLRPLKVTTLSDKSDLKVRFDLFERLNTGGIKLTDQEIRGCVYRGEFNEFINEISKNTSFTKLVNLTDSKSNDGTRQEFVLRFFAYLNDINSFEHSVVGFLNNYMEKSNSIFDYKKNRELFEKTFSELGKILPHGIFRGARKITPVNLFEGISVGAALAIQDGADISNSTVSNWINDDALTKITSEASNNKNRVLERVRYCQLRFKNDPNINTSRDERANPEQYSTTKSHSKNRG